MGGRETHVSRISRDYPLPDGRKKPKNKRKTKRKGKGERERGREREREREGVRAMANTARRSERARR